MLHRVTASPPLQQLLLRVEEHVGLAVAHRLLVRCAQEDSKESNFVRHRGIELTGQVSARQHTDGNNPKA